MGVLIETYWNVNTKKEKVSEYITESLNRNILECKYDASIYDYGGIEVLIETYWNVNL